MGEIIAPAGIRVSLDIYLICDDANEFAITKTVISLCKMKGCPAIDTTEGVEKLTRHAISIVSEVMPGAWRLMTAGELEAYIEAERDDD